MESVWFIETFFFNSKGLFGMVLGGMEKDKNKLADVSYVNLT